MFPRLASALQRRVLATHTRVIKQRAPLPHLTSYVRCTMSLLKERRLITRPEHDQLTWTLCMAHHLFTLRANQSASKLVAPASS